MVKTLIERIGFDKTKIFIPYVDYDKNFFSKHGYKMLRGKSPYIIRGKDYRISLYYSKIGNEFSISNCHLEIWIDDVVVGNLQNYTVEDLHEKIIEIAEYERNTDGLFLKYDGMIFSEMEVNCTFAVLQDFSYYVPALLQIADCLYSKTMKKWYCTQNEKSPKIKWPDTDKITSISMKNESQGYTIYDKSNNLHKKGKGKPSINTIRIEWKLCKAKIKDVFGANDILSITNQLLADKFLENFIKKVETPINDRHDIELKRCKVMYKGSFKTTKTGREIFDIDKFCYNICQYCRDNDVPPFLDVDDAVKKILRAHDKKSRNGEKTFARFVKKFCALDRSEYIHSLEQYEEIIKGVHRCAENVDTENGVEYEIIKDKTQKSQKIKASKTSDNDDKKFC